MMMTSTTRPSGATHLSRRLGTMHIEPCSYVAFRVDPHASLAVLGDPITDYYTKELLEPEQSKVYLGLVLEAHKLVECGRYQLTLSIAGPRPATLSQDDVNTLVPIISPGSSHDSSITRPPVFPVLPLSSGEAYHYPKTIRVQVATTVLLEDYSLFPHGFPRLRKNDAKRLQEYYKHDARQMKALEASAPQKSGVLRDLKPMDMAAEIAQVKTAIREARWDAFDPETPSERCDRFRLLDREIDPTLPGGILHWEPVVTVWMNPHVAGDSLTPPETLDTEIARLKRIADIFNRRWIEWVRAIYVLRSNKPIDLPPIYDRQGRKRSPTALLVQESLPPSGLATRGATAEQHPEGSQGGKKIVVAEAAAAFKEKRNVPAPAKPQKNNRPDRRTGRLRDAQAASNRLTRAARFVGSGVRFAAISSYYAAKLSVDAVRYVVARSLKFTARTSRGQPRSYARTRPVTLRRYKFQTHPQQRC